ncbi:MAG: hypothetical protein LBL94_11770 [Prevotellaceae bacterium]|jgi:hypothetical protein|nr:hypothetical protein [Prevotellaceae bacterium]
MVNSGYKNRTTKAGWLLVCCCALLLVSCKSASRHMQQVVEKNLKGSWVCSNVLDKVACTKSIKSLKDFPPYTELIFLQDSSKLIALNGQVDMVALSYTSNGDALQVPDFYGNGVAHISMAGDSVLLFNDGFSAETWRYTKAPADMTAAESGDVPEVFPSLLNCALIAGEYTVRNTGNPYHLVFRSNGYIFNSPDFTRYSLCYNGNCNILSSENLVYLSNGQQGDYYGWKVQDGTLTIYSLAVANMSDGMMEYEINRPVLVMEKNADDRY